MYIRLSIKEKKALQAAAASEDRSVADWVRLLCRKRLVELGFIEDDKPTVKVVKH